MRDATGRDAPVGAQAVRAGRRAPIRHVVVSASVAVLALAAGGCSSSSNTTTTSSSTAGSTASSTAGSSTSAAKAGSSTATSYPAGKEQLCQARDQLKTSMEALTNPILLTGGADAIKGAVDTVRTDLNAVVAAGKEDYQPQVDAVQSSLQQLQTAVGNLGSGNLAQNLQAVGTEIAAVGNASADLFTQLKASCGS